MVDVKNKSFLKALFIQWPQNIYNAIFAPEVIIQFVIFFLAVIALGFISIIVGNLIKFSLKDISSSFDGLLIDLLFIGVFGQVLTSLNARRQTIKRYREEIEDFLGWNADEAKFRIVGNIKRLNRLGITDINLRGAHLKKVDLKRANLQGADLIDANLEEANLCESNLKGANLWRINLKGANLWMAKLQGANLQFANLEEANLCGANLQKTVLKNAYMQKSFLLDTNLSAAFLYVADLSDARLDTTTILKGARYNTERIELKAWSESSKYKSGNYILFPTKWQVPDPKAVGAQEDNEGNCLK